MVCWPPFINELPVNMYKGRLHAAGETCNIALLLPEH
jgi:hypothetical protein